MPRPPHPPLRLQLWRTTVSGALSNLQSPSDAGDMSSDDGEPLHTPSTDQHDHAAFSDNAQSLEHIRPQSYEKCDEALLASTSSYPSVTLLGSSTGSTCLSQEACRSLMSPPVVSRAVASPYKAKRSPELDPCATSFVPNLQNYAISASPLRLYGPFTPLSDESVTAPPANVLKRASTCVQPGKQSKPKLLRSSALECIPTTLGHAYSQLFPQGHHLQQRFVHSYQLQDELGSGGYGFVMTAHHRVDKHDVAVKFIFKEKVPEHAWSVDDHGKKVPMEAKVLSFVKHESIVNFIDLFEDKLYFYLVQELHGCPWSAKTDQTPKCKFSDSICCSAPSSTLSMSRTTSSDLQLKGVLRDQTGAYASQSVDDTEGRDTSNTSSLHNILSINSTLPAEKGQYQPLIQGLDHLHRPGFARRPSHDLFECIEQSKNKRLSEEDARYIFAQVVDIVDFLDGEGIIHRDIKDENLVIDKNLKVKLIDFGSVVMEDTTQPRPYYHSFFGTAAYAASEILRKRAYQAAPAEIWTLGVLLSYLVTGVSPFPTERHAIEGRITLNPSSGAHVSQPCLHLMARCLELKPKKRANIKEVKAHHWLQGALGRLHF